MENLEKIIAQIKEDVVSIESEITLAKEKGYVYARSRNIRKAAQNIKVFAQNLRTAASDLFKGEAGVPDSN